MSYSELISTLTAVGTIAAAFAAARAAWVAADQVRFLRTQIEQANAQMLTTLSNQQNWELLDRHADLPPALPSWKEQPHTAWA